MVIVLATFALGLVVALCSVALHPRWWGLALAVVATAVTAYALPAGWARIPFAIGWTTMVGYLALGRDEGDYLISSDVEGYTLLAFTVVLTIGAVVTLPPRRRP